jgi:hypothetical protein
MLLWHLGATLGLFRWIFRDPGVDIRLLLLGAVLPDLVDMPIGTLVLTERFSTGELWAHSLIAPVAFVCIVMIVTRRGPRRRALLTVGIGWLFHLLLDGMWLHQEVFLWPFFGAIPPGEAPYWPLAWERALSDPWRWIKELAGLAYLTYLWVTLSLATGSRRRAVIETGRLPAEKAT